MRKLGDQTTGAVPPLCASNQEGKSRASQTLFLSLLSSCFNCGHQTATTDELNNDGNTRALLCDAILTTVSAIYAALLDSPNALLVFNFHTNKSNIDLCAAGAVSCRTSLRSRRSVIITMEPATVHTCPSRGHMGINTAGSTEEEDIPHEEAAQTNGGQGIEGHDCAVQVPGMWADQTDALPVPTLHVK